MIPANYELADMEGEVWESISEFDGYYEVSNLGRVKSLGRFIAPGRGGITPRWINPRILRPAVNKKDAHLQYLYVNPCIDRKCHTRDVHVLVGRAFLPRPSPEKTFLIHKDGNTLNNCADNLEYVTPSFKSKRSFREGNATPAGLGKTGGKSPCARPIIAVTNAGLMPFPSQIDAAHWLVKEGYARTTVTANHILSAVAKAAKNGTKSYGLKWQYP